MSGSAEIYEAAFAFDASWDGFARTAVFECGGERREQLLVDDRCVVPWEILHAGAYLRVGVYGVSGNQTMPTVYSGTMFVARGAEPSEAAREHSPDVFDQIVVIGDKAAQDAERAGESAEDAATSATAAQNAKDAAIEALEAFHAPTATAQTLQPGTPATATYDGQNFTFGIPQGLKGDTPSLAGYATEEYVDNAVSAAGGGGSQWRLLQAVTLVEEVRAINIDLKSLGCSEYRIELETPAPGESSWSATYVRGWMYDRSFMAIYNASVNAGFWDSYPGANNERICIDLLSMSISNDFVALRVKGAWGSNVINGKPLTSYKDSGWMKNPHQNATNSELDDSGHTPFRGWHSFAYERKCMPGTQYFVWGR